MPKPNNPLKLEVIAEGAVPLEQWPEYSKKVVFETIARLLLRRKERNDRTAGQAETEPPTRA